MTRLPLLFLFVYQISVFSLSAGGGVKLLVGSKAEATAREGTASFLLLNS